VPIPLRLIARRLDRFGFAFQSRANFVSASFGFCHTNTTHV